MLKELEKKLTVKEYFDLDDNDPINKWEFSDGKAFAMGGASFEHNDICGNLIQSIRNQIDKYKLKCTANATDQRTKSGLAESNNKYYYPDIVFFCQPYEKKENTLINPSMLIEILSKSTESKDRGEKWAANRRIPSLKYYILISQTKRYVEVFTRIENGQWINKEFEGDAIIDLHEVCLQLELSQIYKGDFAGAII